MKTHQQAIDEIITRFNFEKVHVAMVAIGWKWRGSVPEISDLRETAKDLLLRATGEHLKDGLECGASSGGFVASFDGKIATLLFRVASTEASLDEE